MIKYLGVLQRDEVNDLYGKSIAGIVLYQPARNHSEAQPIKLFEYMAAQLPVVASDFSLWREIVEGSGCGVCVSPDDTDAARAAIRTFFDDRELAQRLGCNGRKAVEQKFNWDLEQRTLLSLYEELLQAE